MFHIVLVTPEIPPNTGNVIRLAANTGCELHLVEPLGFSMEDRYMQRAGSGLPRIRRGAGHADGSALLAAERPDPARLFALSTRGSAPRARAFLCSRATGSCSVPNARPRPPRCWRAFAPAQRLRLPMRAGQRSLNLSNAVAVTVFEAWRQLGFAGAG